MVSIAALVLLAAGEPLVIDLDLDGPTLSEGLPAREALWRAKRVLRERGDAPCNWAGWVLIGDS
jgi:hypothetical protein